MPALALVSAAAAIVQADDGHEGRMRSMIHAAVLAVGLGIGIWWYIGGVTGSVILDRITAMP